MREKSTKCTKRKGTSNKNISLVELKVPVVKLLCYLNINSK